MNPINTSSFYPKQWRTFRSLFRFSHSNDFQQQGKKRSSWPEYSQYIFIKNILYWTNLKRRMEIFNIVVDLWYDSNVFTVLFIQQNSVQTTRNKHEKKVWRIMNNLGSNSKYLDAKTLVTPKSTDLTYFFSKQRVNSCFFKNLTPQVSNSVKDFKVFISVITLVWFLI